MFLYQRLKLDFEPELYLDTNIFERRRNITKLRISDHSLLIEKGRHLKIPREQRLCTKCKIIEDEEHFLFHCKLNVDLRASLIKKIEETDNIKLNDMTENEKFKYFLCPSTPKWKMLVPLLNSQLN